MNVLTFSWVLGAVSLTVLFVGVCLEMVRLSDSIWKALDQFEREARSDLLSRPVDLEVLRKRLWVYAKANCWHRSYGARARQVDALIQGRLLEIKQYERVARIHRTGTARTDPTPD